MLNQARLTIRPLERSDVPAMLAIIRDARAEYGLGTRVESLLEPADLALYDTYQRQRALYSVALLDGEVVGGAGVAPLAGADPLTCELQRMYLRRDARGRGIGTMPDWNAASRRHGASGSFAATWKRFRRCRRRWSSTHVMAFATSARAARARRATDTTIAGCCVRSAA